MYTVLICFWPNGSTTAALVILHQTTVVVITEGYRKLPKDAES